MTNRTYVAVGQMLRWLADGYEQAQTLRIAVGERIRAVLLGMDAASPAEERAATVDEPEGPDRAVSVENPAILDRVEHVEETERRDRAAGTDEAVYAERVGRTDKTVVPERAVAAEDPARLERATTEGRTDGKDRAATPDETVPSDRAEQGDDTVRIDRKQAAAETLKAIRLGETAGPVPILGRSYRRYWEEERDLYREMMRVWRRHPVYPWLSRVRGIGPTLACRLLARLDPAKAPTPSSFQRYCGLATVPGVRYRCGECGLERSWPVGYKVTGKHVALGGQKPCRGSLVRVAGPEDGVRTAERMMKGERRPFDATAKKTMYVIGMSWLKKGGAYERVYRQERERLDRGRPGWNDGRKHMAALRKAEKLFLAHLWYVWREAVGMPTVRPYAHAILGHETEEIDPWEMVEE